MKKLFLAALAVVSLFAIIFNTEFFADKITYEIYEALALFAGLFIVTWFFIFAYKVTKIIIK